MVCRKKEGNAGIENAMLRLKTKAAAGKAKRLGFWSTLPSANAKKNKISEVASTPSPSTTSSSTSVSQSEEEENIETPAQEAKKPAEEKCKLKIADLNKQIVSLTSLRDSGLSGVTKAQINSIGRIFIKKNWSLRNGCARHHVCGIDERCNEKVSNNCVKKIQKQLRY